MNFECDIIVYYTYSQLHIFCPRTEGHEYFLLFNIGECMEFVYFTVLHLDLRKNILKMSFAVQFIYCKPVSETDVQCRVVIFPCRICKS